MNGQDKSKRELTDDAEREHNQQRALWACTSDAIITTDLNFVVQGWNRAAEELYGWSAKEAIGRSRDEVVPTRFEGEGRDGARAKLLREGSWRGEVSQSRRDGTQVVAEASVNLVTNKHGRPVGYIGISRDVTERKRADESMREMTAIVEASPAVAFQWRNEEGWPVDYVSDNVSEFFGYSAEDFHRGRVSYADIVHPEDLERTQAEIVTFSADSKRTRFQHEPYRILTKAGAVKWVDDRTVIRRDQAGNITHFQGIVLDITDRMRAELRLQLERDKLTAILESMADGAYIVSKEYGIEYVNPVLLKELGPPGANRCHQYLQNSDLPCSFCRNEEVFAGKTVRWEWTLPHSGRTYDIIDTPLKTADGGLSKLAVFRDTTDRRRAEEALRRSEDRLQAIFESVADYIVVLDRDLRIEMINRAEPGRSSEVVMGRPLYELAAPEDQVRIKEQLERVVQGGGSQQYNTVYTRSYGSQAHFSSVAAPIVASGKVTGVVVSARDISDEVRLKTEKEQLEALFRQSQKMESIGRLAGGVAHDFNNLLTVISSYGEFIDTKLLAGDPLKDDIHEVLVASDRAATLTRQLLAFSRKQVLEPAVLDLNGIVLELEKMLKRLIGEDIVLLSSLSEDLGRVRADPGQIEQVLMNLAVNARDAMPRGGMLTIETHNAELDEAYASKHPGARAGRYVMLAVTDNGVGMSREVVERIFEPFYTTKEQGQGTGLGLATVYGIVKQSGGVIWAYSEPGQGTTFKVYLPRVEGEISQPRDDADTAALSGTETVLVVEDEEAVRRLTCRILAASGYTVICAANGGEALLECERHRSEIHLILTDVVMPRMSGKELAERLAQLKPGLRVLYMSGYTDDAIVQHGVLQAGTQFIAKPFSSVDLLKKVRVTLDSE